MKISISLEALTGRFETDIQRASKRFNRNMKNMERNAKRMARRLALSITAVTAATIALVRASANQIDAINDTAQMIGVNIESLQEYRFAAERFGISNQGIEDSLRRLTRRAGEFANSGAGPAAKAFEALGIEVVDAGGKVKSTEQIFDEIVKQLEGVESDAQAAALAAQLFGDDFGPKLVPLLRQGTDGIRDLRQEFKQFGITITQADAESIGRMNDNLDDMGRLAKGLAQRFSIELAPAIIAISELLVEAAQESEGFEDATTDAVGGVVGTMGFMADSVDAAIRLVKIFQNTAIAGFAAVKVGVLGLADSIINGPNRAINLLLHQVDKIPGIDIDFGFSDLMPSLAQDIRIAESVVTSALEEINNILLEALPSDVLAERIRQVRAELETAAQELDTAGAATGGGVLTLLNPNAGDEVQKILGQIDQKLREFGLDEDDRVLLRLIDAGAEEDQIARAANILNELKILRSEEKESADALARRNALQKEYESLISSTRTQQELHAAELQRVEELYVAGIIPNAQEYHDLLLRIEQRQADANKKVAELDEFGKQAARNMQTQLADTLFDPFDEGLDGMLQGWIETLRRMAAEALAAGIFKSLFGEAGGQAGGLSGLFGGSEGGFGAFISSIFGRAAGGPIYAGNPYLVGERGPELILPGASGTVVPNDQLGGQQTHINNFNFPPETSPRTREHIFQEAGNRQRIALARNS